MCGIFSCLYAQHPESSYQAAFDLIRHRGPDQSTLQTYEGHVIGFHRLAINDLSDRGNQPLRHPKHPHLVLICNGEIYNHSDLVKTYNFKPYSNSDCEVILHMYERFGLDRTLRELDGYFTFVLFDHSTPMIARDTIGVRSLYMGYQGTSLAVASELKALHGWTERICPFPPGHYWCNGRMTQYTKGVFGTPLHDSYQVAIQTTKRLLEAAVEKRVHNTERPIGCLLSGGLDSSLIAALVCKYSDKPVHTFSIGMKGSVDTIYAQRVAKHLNTIHHEVILTEEEMLAAIPEVVRQLETYDTTTVRAGTPMYLLSRYISQNTDIRVIFSGEGSDELSGSYAYFKKAPSATEFYSETLRITNDLQYFDVLRCDKSISAFGLEARVPFLDTEFMNYYLHINPEFKLYDTFDCEKFLLRDAFRDMLPNEVLWRTKEAFSDGVSTQQRSWYQIIQEHVEKLELPFVTYLHNPPQLKETAWYRSLFETYYPNTATVIPYYWLPRWCGSIIDPSARTLAIYK